MLFMNVIQKPNSEQFNQYEVQKLEFMFIYVSWLVVAGRPGMHFGKFKHPCCLCARLSLQTATGPVESFLQLTLVLVDFLVDVCQTFLFDL